MDDSDIVDYESRLVDVPRPPALVTAVAKRQSANPSIGALAMNGFVVWGNHSLRRVL